jgi:hypothetical protein
VSSYQLEWDAGVPSGDFLQLVDTAFTTYTVSGLSVSYNDQSVYRFRIRSKNVCGWSEFSDELSVIKKTAPSQISEVVVSESGCSLRFDWNAPLEDGG